MNEIDQYIAGFSIEVQDILNQVREIVKALAPDSVEKMAYGMPGYKLKGKPFFYFAAYKNHIGIYATPEAHKAFEKELKGYKQGKGSVQFPLDKPIPYNLIEKIIHYKITKTTF